MCTQIDFSDDDLVQEKNSIQNMGDSGGTTDIIDNRYQQKKSQAETKTRFQLPKGEHKQHRRTNAHWRTQSATEINSQKEFLIEPVTEVLKVENQQSIPAKAIYDQFREKLKN